MTDMQRVALPQQRRVDDASRSGWTRREMLARGGMGLGSLALADVFARECAAASSNSQPLAPKAPHFAPRAKRVIHLFMNGGVSHVDSLDEKPLLTKFHGKTLPTLLRTERKTGAAFGSPFKFSQHGDSGLSISELFPHIARSADDLCVIRSMYADVPNHEPSYLLMNCGDGRQARPAMGGVGHLWTGLRESELARLHCDVSRRRSGDGGQ